MTIDHLDREDRRYLLKWAVIEHYRLWLFFDGLEIARIRENDDKLTPPAVQRIAQEYNVLQSTPKGTSKLRMAKNIVRLLSGENRDHPSSLLARAERCAWLAKEAKRLGYVKNREASAMTKLMWFLKPGGWTMFDRYAADAIGTNKYPSPIDRMEEFYSNLSERDFESAARRLGSALRENGWCGLHGERVVDKFLWLSEADDRGYVIDNCKIFLTLLPNGIGDRLEHMAREISEQHAHDLLRKTTN